jgi:hypothetical protein
MKLVGGGWGEVDDGLGRGVFGGVYFEAKFTLTRGGEKKAG